MRVAVLCGGRRGQRVLERISELLPDSELVVVSFREDAHEPPFLSSIRELTVRRGGHFIEARRVGSSHLRDFWQSTDLDLMLVAGWRYLIPSDVYQRARRGAFGFHDSLLPEYRGFSPTVWAMINGEAQTGVTLFEIDGGIDTGDVVDQICLPIGADDTIAEVTERVTYACVQLLESHLTQLLAGTSPRRKQDESRATYTCKRTLTDNLIDWNAPTERIFNLIRAVTAPYPGAFTYLDGQLLRVWSASRLPAEPRYVGRIPGRIVAIRPREGAVVLTADGALLLREVQLDGNPPLCAADVLRSISQTLGSRME